MVAKSRSSRSGTSLKGLEGLVLMYSEVGRVEDAIEALGELEAACPMGTLGSVPYVAIMEACAKKGDVMSATRPDAVSVCAHVIFSMEQSCSWRDTAVHLKTPSNQ